MIKEAVTDGELELLRLSSEGEVDDVRELLKEGISPNICDENGSTPLHLATQDNQSEVVEELLKKKAAVDVMNGAGATALHIACDAENAQNDCLILLLKAKANLELRDPDQNTALHVLSRYGHVEAVDMLLGGKANVAAKDSSGQTPLHIASEQGHYEVVRALLEAKADQNARDTNERRPRDLASDDEVIKLLTLWGNKALDKSFYKKDEDYYDYGDDMDDFIEDDLPKGPQCNCGVYLVKGALFCQGCGKKQPVPTSCVNCKIVLPAGAKFCMQCGAKVGITARAVAPVSKPPSKSQMKDQGLKPASKDSVKGSIGKLANSKMLQPPTRGMQPFDKNTGAARNGTALKKSAVPKVTPTNLKGTGVVKASTIVDKSGPKQPSVETTKRISPSSSSSAVGRPLSSSKVATSKPVAASSKPTTSVASKPAVTSKPAVISKSATNSTKPASASNTVAPSKIVVPAPKPVVPSSKPVAVSSKPVVAVSSKPVVAASSKAVVSNNEHSQSVTKPIPSKLKSSSVTPPTHKTVSASGKSAQPIPEKRQATEPLPLPTAKRRQIPKKGELPLNDHESDDTNNNKAPESLSTEELLYALSTSQDLKAVITAKQREVVIEKPPRLPGVIAHAGAGVVVGRTKTFNKLTDMTAKRQDEPEPRKPASKSSKSSEVKVDNGKSHTDSKPLGKNEPTSANPNQLARSPKKRHSSELNANLKAKAEFLKPRQSPASGAKPASEAADTYMRTLGL